MINSVSIFNLNRIEQLEDREILHPLKRKKRIPAHMPVHKQHQTGINDMAASIKESNTYSKDNYIEEKAKKFVAAYDKGIKKGLNTTTAKFFVLKDLLDGKIKTKDLDNYSTIIKKDGKCVLVKFVKNEDGSYVIYSKEGSLDELKKLKTTPVKQLKVQYSFSISVFNNGELISNFPKFYKEYHK